MLDNKPKHKHTHTVSPIYLYIVDSLFYLYILAKWSESLLFTGFTKPNGFKLNLVWKLSGSLRELWQRYVFDAPVTALTLPSVQINTTNETIFCSFELLDITLL